MRFYFFHEYLSHSFSCWQHTDFVEGYLVWAAKEMFFRITGDKVRHAFIKDTFEVSLMGSRDMATVKLNAAKMVAEWFQSMTDGKFLAFILDWAADSSYLVDRADIDALFYLSEMCTKGMHLLEDICTAFEEANLQATRCKLRSIARQTAGIPDYEGHFHPDSVLPCLVC